MTDLIEIKRSYEIFGLDVWASKEDAKRAYYKLAKVYHPDKNRAPNASEMFRAIKEADECIQKATDEDIIRCRSEETVRRLRQAVLRPIEIGTYDLLKFEFHSKYQAPIVYQPPDASGMMFISENQGIIQIVDVLGVGDPINLSGTFKLQDPGFMLIERVAFRNGRSSKVTSDGYYAWNGQNLTIHIGVTSEPTGPYPGVRNVLKGVWCKR